MGYQNKGRPNKKEHLIVDIQMDLTDLREDIRLGLPQEYIFESIDFIKKSVLKLQRSLKKEAKG